MWSAHPRRICGFPRISDIIQYFPTYLHTYIQYIHIHIHIHFHIHMYMYIYIYITYINDPLYAYYMQSPICGFMSSTPRSSAPESRFFLAGQCWPGAKLCWVNDDFLNISNPWHPWYWRLLHAIAVSPVIVSYWVSYFFGQSHVSGWGHVCYIMLYQF